MILVEIYSVYKGELISIGDTSDKGKSCRNCSEKILIFGAHSKFEPKDSLKSYAMTDDDFYFYSCSRIDMPRHKLN